MALGSDFFPAKMLEECELLPDHPAINHGVSQIEAAQAMNINGASRIHICLVVSA